MPGEKQNGISRAAHDAARNRVQNMPGPAGGLPNKCQAIFRFGKCAAQVRHPQLVGVPSQKLVNCERTRLFGFNFEIHVVAISHHLTVESGCDSHGCGRLGPADNGVDGSRAFSCAFQNWQPPDGACCVRVALDDSPRSGLLRFVAAYNLTWEKALEPPSA